MMNNLEAYKMDGLGNDFIIFDNRKKTTTLSKDQILKIAMGPYAPFGTIFRMGYLNLAYLIANRADHRSKERSP